MTIVPMIPMAVLLQERTPLIRDDTHYVLREERPTNTMSGRGKRTSTKNSRLVPRRLDRQ